LNYPSGEHVVAEEGAVVHIEGPSQRRSRPRRGIAAVELALVAPLILILLVGLLEAGRVVQVTAIVSNAAREGARKASTGANSFTDVQTTVTNYLTNAGITNQTGLTVTVYNVTQGNSGPHFNPSQAVSLDQLLITVTLPYSNIQLTQFPNAPSTLITGRAVWFSNQNQAYPTNITPPSGS
jgi:Flp pilus assembly protein TadG